MGKILEEFCNVTKQDIDKAINEVDEKFYKKEIYILGTIYTIYTNVNENDEPRIRNLSGFCDYSTKEIFISSEVEKEDEDSLKNLKYYKNKVIRHEIIHAFLYESGLRENSNMQVAWSENEEMVDWFAMQSPKILKVFQELDII